MSVELLIKALVEADIFDGLDPRLVTALACIGTEARYSGGETLAVCGQPADAAQLILRGSVRCGNDPSAVPLSAGTMIGETAMLVEHVHQVDVVAVADTEVLKFVRTDLHRLMGTHPAIAAHFEARLHRRLEVMARELRAAVQRMDRQVA